MAEDAIGKAGLYFDELNKIRVLEPEVTTQTNDLKDECKDFLEKMTQFQTIVSGFIQHIEGISSEVEKEKLKAIASRNQLKSVTKQREAIQQQLQALIREKKMQLERLRIQHESLVKEEREQTEFIEQLILQK